MKTLKKEDLAEDIQETLGIAVHQSKVEATKLIGIVKEAIFNKELVYIPKHMKIGSSIKAERPGRNPKTGKDCVIARRHSVRAATNTFSKMASKLTKSAFIDEVVKQGHTIVDATTLVELFYNFIGNIHNGKHRIELRGLGSFNSELRKDFVIRDPRTGEVLGKKTYYLPKFKCSDSLRKAMDKQYL